MRLPLITNRKTHYPSKQKCLWCKKGKVSEPHSMAVLNSGALLVDRRKRVGGPNDNLEGFFFIEWHGAHKNEGGIGIDADKYEIIEIARDVRGGQFSISFCSTKCMRAFLNFSVDQLEEKVRRKPKS